jgi:GxxExxY protein
VRPSKFITNFGYGFLHRVYQRSLQVELLRNQHAAEWEKRINVRYKETVVGDYDADLIVDDCVLVEVKIARSTISATKRSY